MIHTYSKYYLLVILIIVPFLFSSFSCSHYRTIPGSELPSVSLLRKIINIKSDSTSTLIGQVLDRDSDEPVFFVNVAISDLKFVANTDTTGNYIIENIPKGIYEIKAFGIGYKTTLFDRLEIDGGQLIILDFRMAREEMQFYD